MKSIIKLSFLFTALVFFSCTNKGTEVELSEKHGGTLKMSLGDNILTLYPPHITHFTSITVAYQIYEGLVKINPETSKIEPALAKSWEPNEDATVYTFNLRTDVNFHKTATFKGRKFVASDVKESFTQLCEATDNNFYAKFLTEKVKGAAEYFESSKNKDGLVKEVTGFVALNDSTFQVTLNSSFRGLEKLLSIGVFVVFPAEAFGTDLDNLNKAIGTGPFKVKAVTDGEKVELVKNENYWKKDSEGYYLPYLDGIEFTFTSSKAEEIKQFLNNDIHLIKDIPVDEISNILPSLEKAKSGENADFNYISSPGLDIKMLMFNHKKELFKNINVRKAFNYAINRNMLVDSVLLGDRNPAGQGLIPHAEIFGDYRVKGFNYNPEKAKEYLELAGYPNGKGFPTIKIHGISRKIDSLSVNEVARMLKKNLNVNVTVDNSHTISSLGMKFSKEENTMDMWRYNWIADYPDPETFLQLFYGDNISDYNNEQFNALIKQALNEGNETKRYKIYFDADQTLVDDAAFIPLMYNDLIYLTSKEFKNFKANPLDYRDFREVYFEKTEQ